MSKTALCYSQRSLSKIQLEVRQMNELAIKMPLAEKDIANAVSDSIEIATARGCMLPNSIFSVVVMIPDHYNLPVLSVSNTGKKTRLGEKYASSSRIIANRIWQNKLRKESGAMAKITPIHSPFGKFWGYKSLGDVVIVCIGLQPNKLNDLICTLILSKLLESSSRS